MLQLDHEEEAVEAAKRLYELCDVAHKNNRETMVASGNYDVLNPLSECLLHTNEEKLHYVCLTLNNLSIPYDNKKVMVLERVAKKLIRNLCTVISMGNKQSYLCIICLTNLSYYDPGIKSIGQFSPKPKSESRWKRNKIPPLENSKSLIRTLQNVTANASRGTADFRWAFALLAQLAKHDDNALLMGITTIPMVALENIQESKLKPSEWKTNSLEDLSLFLILHLAEVTSQGLDNAIETVEPIMRNDTGVQGLKATMICAFMGVPWDFFPDFGVVSAGAVSELMGNAFERKGKRNVYEGNVFRLQTATKAYAAMAKAAAKADEEASNGALAHSKTVALPTTIALLLQIIAEITANYMDDESEHAFSECFDPRAAELAVAAIASLLPALLEKATPPRKSLHSETACISLAQLFQNFAKSATSGLTKEKATDTADKIKESRGAAVPLLEAAYDLWHSSTDSSLFHNLSMFNI